MSDQLPAPVFNAAYTVPLTDIGSGYAAGITQAGKSLAQAIGTVADIGKQNVDANDTLAAMHQTGILSPEEYQAVMGKSLGAKQSMVGLYAGQWIADQAARREQALKMGQSTADIATEHAKLLDTIQAVKSGYGQAARVDVGKLPINQQQNKQAQTAQPVPTAPQVQPTQPLTPGQQLAGTPAQPTPLGSGDIYNPLQAGVIIGAPLAGNDPITPGSVKGKLRGQPGYFMPDNRTFRATQR
jgi:hypothetical protein